MINRNQLKFHESFQPETNYISKIISLAADNYIGKKDDISDYTGIPTGKSKGKVIPSIKYAKFMGLINDYDTKPGEYSLSLTPLGKKVYLEDKYLHEVLTIWLCHIGITSPLFGAIQWSYLVHKGHVGFANNISPEYLLTRANSSFGVKVTLSELFSPVKLSYTEGFFSSLDFLSWDKDICFNEKRESQELVFIYTYMIYKGWYEHFFDKVELTFLELQNDIGFGKTFGFSDDETNQVLDTLTREGVIVLNRQLFPITLRRTSSIDDIISSLYSRLL